LRELPHPAIQLISTDTMSRLCYETGMKRREFISMLGGALTAWPFAAQAQQEPRARRVPVVGFVGLASTAVDDDRHCERSEAIHAVAPGKNGAMTGIAMTGIICWQPGG
jgi:hypothetical protein